MKISLVLCAIHGGIAATLDTEADLLAHALWHSESATRMGSATGPAES